MTTMNNEDPADPSVHEPRVIGEIVGTRHTPTGTGEFWGYWAEGYKPVGKVRVVDADQMREAIAAERALLLTDIAALREALDEAATDCELHPLYLGDSATLDDIIRTGGGAAFVTGLARGLREALGSAAEKEQPK